MDTPMNSSDEANLAEREERLGEAKRHLFEHPHYRGHQETEALFQTITAVYVPNWRDLVALLETASKDETLAFELIQNVRPSTVRDRFQAVTARCLHNYLASSMTLVDHVRRTMAGRTGQLADEFKSRKEALLQNPEIPFMQDLRNFTLHRTLPFLAHRLSMTNVNTPEQTFESEVELSVAQLLEWDEWSTASRRFLENSGETVALRPVVQRHGQLVLDLNAWVHTKLVQAIDIDQLNELIVEINAALAGVDKESAKQLTDEWTRRRGGETSEEDSV